MKTIFQKAKKRAAAAAAAVMVAFLSAAGPAPVWADESFETVPGGTADESLSTGSAAGDTEAASDPDAGAERAPAGEDTDAGGGSDPGGEPASSEDTGSDGEADAGGNPAPGADAGSGGSAAGGDAFSMDDHSAAGEGPEDGGESGSGEESGGQGADTQENIDSDETESSASDEAEPPGTADNAPEVMPLSADEISVATAEEFEAAVTQEGRKIRLDADIALTGTAAPTITAAGLRIIGSGHKLTLPAGQKLILKSDGLNVSDLVIEGTASTGVQIYGNVRAGLENVTIRRNTNGGAGLQVAGGATAALSGTFITRNYGISIQVQNKSTLNVDNLNLHYSDNASAVAVQLVDAGVNGSTLTDESKYGTVTADGAKKNYAFPSGQAQKVVVIKSYADLNSYAGSQTADALLDFQADITLAGSPTLDKSNVMISGNGFTVDNGGGNKLTLKGQNCTLRQLGFKNYTSLGLQIWGGSPTLEDVSFDGGSKNNTVGLAVKSGATVALKGKIETKNNKTAGIQRFSGGGTLDMGGVASWKSEGDGAALLDSMKGAAGLSMPVSVYWTKTEDVSEDRYFVGPQSVTNQAELEAAVANDNSTVKLAADFTVDRVIRLDKNIDLDGAGHTIAMSDGAKLVFTRTHTVRDLRLEGPSGNEAILIDSGGADVTLVNLSIDGGGTARTAVPQDAVVIDNRGKAAFAGTLETANHQNTFRVRNAAVLNLYNVTAHTTVNETNAVVLADQKNGGSSTLIPASGAPPYSTDPTESGSDYIYPYTAGTSGIRYIYSYEDLAAWDKKTDRGITLEICNDITLTNDVSLQGEDLVLSGNGKTITNSGGRKMTLQGKNQTLSDLTFKGYGGGYMGLQIYGQNNSAVLENVSFVPDASNTNAAGLVVSSAAGRPGPEVTLKGSFSTSGHKGAGIRVASNPASCTVTLDTDLEYSSTDDAVAVQVLNVNDSKKILVKPDPSPFAETAAAPGAEPVRNYYTSFYEITDFAAFKGAASPGNAGRTVKIMNDFAFPPNAGNVEFGTNVPGLVIEGGGHTITLSAAQTADEKIVFKGKQTLKNAAVTGHISQAIQVYGASAEAVIENVVLKGENAANTGLMVSSGGSAVLTDAETSGHKSEGILVLKGSSLTLKGEIRSSGDANALVDYYADGVNTIVFPTADSYAPYDSRTEDAANKKTVYQMYARIEVRTEAELAAALAVPNTMISMKADITLTEQSAGISWDKLRSLDGEAHTLALAGGRDITLKYGQTLRNLTVTGHTGQAIQVYGPSADALLENVTVKGENAGNTGIMINGGGTAVLTDITTSGHKSQGILVQRGSSLTLKGTIHSSGDANALVDYYADGVNTIVFPTADSYAPYDSRTEDAANKKTVYQMYARIEVRTEAELAAALAVPNTMISMKADITLTEQSAGISWDKLRSLDGEDHTLTLAGGRDITLKYGQTLRNLTVTGHTGQAIQVYGPSADALLENVTVKGENAGNTGIMINGGGTAVLTDITTSGHKSQGILVQRGSSLTLKGEIHSSGDANALVDYYADGVNTIVFPTADSYAPYDSRTEDAVNKKTVYQMSTRLEVRTEAELAAALAVPNAVIAMKNDITLQTGSDNLLWSRTGTLDGGGFTLDTGGVSLQIAGTVTLKNIKITGYQGAKPGVVVSGAKAAAVLDGVTLDGGTDTQTGLDIAGGAKVMIASGGVFTNGHTQQGIRIRGGSSLDMANGRAGSIRDTASLNMITVEGETDNTVRFPDADLYEGPFTDSDRTGAGKERRTDTYMIFNRVTVTSEEELRNAVEQKNVCIVLGADIAVDPKSRYPMTGEETGEILFPSFAKLDGAGHTIDLQNDRRAQGAQQVRLVFKGKYADVRNLTVTGYISNGLTLYRVPQAVLDGVEMKGIADKSTTGLVIQGSAVELHNLSLLNHTARGVQITGQTTNEVTLPSAVTAAGKWTSINNKITVKVIVQPADTADSTLSDGEKLFFTNGRSMELSETGYTYAWNYYLTDQQAAASASEEALVKALTTTGSRIELTNDVVFQSPHSAWKDEEGKNALIEVAPGVQLLGNGHVIDLKGKTGLIIKGGDVTMRDVTVRNARQDGITAYNSRNVTLTSVTVERCGRWGLVLNGSEVLVHDLATRRNYAGGIQLSRSRTLRAASCTDSRLIIKGNIRHEECGFNIQIKNVEMLTNRRAGGTLAKNDDGTLQDPVSRPSRWTSNTVVRAEGEEDTIAELYTVYKEPVKYNKLSDYYVDLFNYEEEEADEYYTDPPRNDRDPNTLYGEQEVNYMAVRRKLNVKYQDELKDGETPVRLLGSKAEDPQAEKRKLERLVAFAAANGYMLYFPADTYTLCGDLNLTHLGGLPSLSNFGFAGDADEPCILRACTGTDRCSCASAGMLRIGSFNAGDGNKDYYRYPVYYMRVENMVFDNVGIAMDSAYKRGLEVVNNVFINGGYKGPYPKTKTIAGEEVAGTEVELFPYVTANSLTATITGNIFLRSRDHAGKGISVYRSKESLISSNIFGNPKYLSADSGMFRVPGVLTRLEMIREFEGRLGLDLSQENGNFFTGINAVGYDENLRIQSNYFHMEPTKNVTISNQGAVNGIHFIQGLNETLRENWQRRDHIIYGKSYQNIYVENNYFYGQENGGAGGLKLRNGKGIYVGSNYFHNAPLLVYVYNDLASSGGSNVLSDAIIYNNTFQTNSNFGKSHSGILYYQSFQNTRREYADIRNFVMYNNRFLSDYRDNITISQNVLIGEVDRSGEFFGHGNVYACGASGVPSAASPDVPIPWNFTGRAKINPGDRVANGSIGWQEVSEEQILSRIEKASVAAHFFDPDAEAAPWLNAVPAIVPPVDYSYFDQVLASAEGSADPGLVRQARAFRSGGAENTQAECNLWATYLIAGGADEIVPPVSGMENEPDPVESMPDEIAEADTRFDDAEQTKDLEDKKR